MASYPPPVLALTTGPGLGGLALPTSAPHDATSYASGSQQEFMPDYTNTADYPDAAPTQPAPMVPESTLGAPSFLPFDYVPMYAPPAPAQNTVLPPPAAFYSEQPNTLLPFPFAQDAMYPAPYTFSQDEMNMQMMMAAAPQFMPALPHHLPPFPPVPGGVMLPPQYLPQQWHHSMPSPFPTAPAGEVYASSRPKRKRCACLLFPESNIYLFSYFSGVPRNRRRASKPKPKPRGCGRMSPSRRSTPKLTRR